MKEQGKTYFDDEDKSGPGSSARPQVSRELSVDERHPAAGVDGVDDNSLSYGHLSKQELSNLLNFCRKGYQHQAQNSAITEEPRNCWKYEYRRNRREVSNRI